MLTILEIVNSIVNYLSAYPKTLYPRLMEAGFGIGAWGGDIDNFLSILLLRQEPLVRGGVPAQG